LKAKKKKHKPATNPPKKHKNKQKNKNNHSVWCADENGNSFFFFSRAFNGVFFGLWANPSK